MAPPEGNETGPDPAVESEPSPQSQTSGNPYRRLFDTFGYGIALYARVTDSGDDSMRILTVNDAFKQLTGLGAELVEGEPVTAVLPEIGGQPVVEAVEAVAGGGTDREFEQYFEPLDAYCEIAVVSLGNGLVASSFVDTTERRKQQADLYESVLAGIDDAVLIIDEEYTIEYANDRVLSFFEASPGEIRGRHVVEDLPDLTRDDSGSAALRKALTTVFSGSAEEQTRVELPVKLPGGAKTIEISCSSVTVRDARKAVLIARDITERKERLRERETMSERLETVVSNVPVVLFGLDSDGLITVSEGAGLGKLGLEPKEVVGESVFDIYGAHDEIIADAKRALQGETIEEVYDINGLSFQTTWKPVAEQPSRGETAVIGVAHDITERKRREQELKQTNERLDSFASRLAHELRNPLTVMASRLSLARETGSQEHFQHLERSLNRMERLIDDLLVLAKEGEVPIETRPVDMGTVSAVCWAVIRSPYSDIEIETTSRIMADEDRLRQLFENLFRNAVEHTGKGTTVTVGDLEDGFYVEDDGPGIDAGKREAMFEQGVTDLAHGTGLGLTIVREMGRIHGWSVTVTDSDEGGARFEFRGVERATE